MGIDVAWSAIEFQAFEGQSLGSHWLQQPTKSSAKSQSPKSGNKLVTDEILMLKFIWI